MKSPVDSIGSFEKGVKICGLRSIRLGSTTHPPDRTEPVMWPGRQVFYYELKSQPLTEDAYDV
jgi:hypothetical protein